MWYLGSVFSLFLILGICAVAGQLFVGCLPYRLRPVAGVFLSPLLGLAALVLLATLVGWIGRGYDRAVTTSLTGLLVGAGAWRCRKCSRARSVAYFGLLWGFGLLASFPALATVMRRASFNTQNDTFIYLTQAQWLQKHGFRQPVFEPLLHPALSQVWFFQQHGLRMGASFCLGWLQSLLGLKWSVDIYPATAGLGLICGALVAGAVVLTVCPQRRTEAWLVALTIAASLNGFAFGSIAGFLPQTFGLALAGGAFALRGLEIASCRRGDEPAATWLGTLPQALCLAAAMLCYSELTPFLIAGMAGSYLLPWPRSVPGGSASRTVARRCRRVGKLAVLGLLLTNLEWARVVQAIQLQLHLRAGGPVDWQPWEFLAHAVGLRSGAGDGPAWYFAQDGWTIVPGLFSVALFVGLLRPLARFGQAWNPRWRALWPMAVLVLLYVAAFLFFRYISRSPWPDQPGLRHLVGQTFYQLRLSHWSSLPLLACLLVGLIALGRLGKRAGRGLVLALLLLWSAGGLSANYQLGALRAAANEHSAGQARDVFLPYVEWEESLAKVPHTDLIYLDMTRPADYLARQLVAYYLQDWRLASNWETDGYINPWLPRDQPMPGQQQCDWIISRSVIQAPHPPGYLVITPTLQRSLTMVQMDCPYGRETNGKDWWCWTGNRLHFEYQAKGPRPQHVRLSFTYHPVSDQRTLTVQLTGLGTDLTQEIPMLVGDHPYVTPPLAWQGDSLAIDFSCPAPPLRGPATDPRDFSFQIINLSLVPLD